MNWFDTKLAVDILPLLLKASLITIFVTICGFLLALVIGIPLVLGRRSSFYLVSRGFGFVIEFIRSTPLLVQIYFLYYVLPDAGIHFSPITTGIAALALHYGCYISEVYRSALESVPRGQWDAAIALGYSRIDSYLHIITPQIMPRVVPTAGSFLVYMIKETPLLASIGVQELMYAAKDIGQERFQYLEPITMCGLVFLVFSSVFSIAVTQIEQLVGRRWIKREQFHG